MTIRTVTGNIIDLTGVDTPNATFSLLPETYVFGSTSSEVVFGDLITVVADGSGDVSFDIHEGKYVGRISTSQGPKTFRLVVDSEGPWTLGRLIGPLGEFTPTIVTQIFDAADRAEAARDAAEGFRDETSGFRNEAEGFRDQSESSATAASLSEQQAQTAAILAGAPIAPDFPTDDTETAALSSPFLFIAPEGVQSWTHSGTLASLEQGPYVSRVEFDDVTALFAYDGPALPEGSIIRTRAEGFSYEVAASSATDQHVTTAGGVKLYVLPGDDGFYSMGAVGIDETGSSDVGATFAAVAAAFGKVNLTTGATYLFANRQTISGVAGLHIKFNGATIHSPDIDGALLIDDCLGCQLDAPKATGEETRTTWNALTTAERTEYKPLIEVKDSPMTKVRNSHTAGKRSGIWLNTCVDSVVDHPYHKGCFGPTSEGVAPDGNWGAGLFLRGCHRSSIFNPKGRECGEVVLIGNNSVGVKSYGGDAVGTHDTAFYVSSGTNCIVSGFYVEDNISVGGGAVKCRGSGNQIRSCVAKDIPNAIPFHLTGFANTAFLDSKGAIGSGGGIYNCIANDCLALLAIRFVTAEDSENYYMRDVEAAGNQGFNLTGTSPNRPIQALGLDNIKVSGNKVDGFAADYALFLSGVSTASLTRGVVHGNAVSGGDRAVLCNFCTTPVVADQELSALTGTYVVGFLNLTAGAIIDGNKALPFGTPRADLRGLSDVVARNNEGLNIFANATDSFFGSGNSHQSGFTVGGGARPLRIGQVRLGGDGNAYIAKGTASEADWVLL